MRFLEAFLIYCMLDDSPSLDDRAYAEMQANHNRTANEGRDPDLKLVRDGKEVSLREWAREIIASVRAIAEIIDRGEDGNAYTQSVDAQSELIEDADGTPSARVIQDMTDNGTGFLSLRDGDPRKATRIISRLWLRSKKTGCACTPMKQRRHWNVRRKSNRPTRSASTNTWSGITRTRAVPTDSPIDRPTIYSWEATCCGIAMVRLPSIDTGPVADE